MFFSGATPQLVFAQEAEAPEVPEVVPELVEEEEQPQEEEAPQEEEEVVEEEEATSEEEQPVVEEDQEEEQQEEEQQEEAEEETSEEEAVEDIPEAPELPEEDAGEEAGTEVVEEEESTEEEQQEEAPVEEETTTETEELPVEESAPQETQSSGGGSNSGGSGGLLNPDDGDDGENGEDTYEEETEQQEDGIGEEGYDGEDGNDNGIEYSDDDATVTTGNSYAGGDLDNTVNTNTLETDYTGGTTTATTTGNYDHTYTEGVDAHVDQTIENDNVGTTTNDATIDGNTGSNSAGSSANALIDTGYAVSEANAVNVVNTNVIDSNGFIGFLNYLFGDTVIDLRNIFDMLMPGDRGYGDDRSPCDLTHCADTTIDLNAINDNTATIQNDLIVRAATGDNAAYAGSGHAGVTTGNAYASANAFNVANTNIVDSNYLLLSVNNFGDLSEDIVFPGMDYFLDLFSIGGGSLAQNTDINNDNTLALDNNVGTDADTGNNLVEGPNTTIDTGDSYSMTNVLNQVNQNLVGGTSLQILFQIHGDWNGEIYGLPDGIMWEETPQGIVLRQDPNYALAGSGLASVGGNLRNLTIDNTNDASITNNIDVLALSGDNYAGSYAGSAGISTGDAYAAANVVNVANTNVVGQNWITAIFNIFGDWNGDISFGRSDLWIGGRAESLTGGFGPGSRVRYTFTITNFGDLAATDVRMHPAFNRALLAFDQFDGYDENGDGVWDIGDMAPGDSKELTYDATITEDLPIGYTPINVDATVGGNENDGNISDNTESLTVNAKFGNLIRGGGRVLRVEDAKLKVEKKLVSEDNEITASSTAEYEIIIKNRGGPAYHAKVHDVIYAPDGSAIHAQTWELGTIERDEDIYLTYEVFFNASSTPGEYLNVARIEAMENHDSLDKAYGNELMTEPVTATVYVVGGGYVEEPEISEEIQEILDENPVEECSQYVTHYIKQGQENDLAQVARLQMFLNDFEGEALSVNGLYDDPTYQAVHRFQDKYFDDILGPWGAPFTTGFVYYTTQKKINEIYCGYEKQFPLNDEQQSEINGFKAKLEEFDAIQESDVDFLEVGYDPEADDLDTDTAELASAPVEEVIEKEVSTSQLQEPEPTQTASVADAIPTITGQEVSDPASSLFKRIKSGITDMFGWLSLKFEKAKQVTFDR